MHEKRLEANVIRCHYSRVISWCVWNRTEGPPRTGHGRREAKLGPGPPDPRLDGLGAAVIDDCGEGKTR